MAALVAPIAASQGGVSPESTFEQVFAAYRRGNADAAVAAFARWPPARVKAEATLGEGVDDVRSIAALALLHTEAAIRNGVLGSFAPDAPQRIVLGGWGFSPMFEVHSYSAFTLIDRLAKRARASDDANTLSYARSWYILVISYCVRAGRRACHEELIDKGEYDVEGDNDPEYLLLIGSRDEPRRRARPGDRRRMPLPISALPSGGSLVGFLPSPDPLASSVQQSRWAFARALERNPMLVEARLRLGRIYWVTNERARAERELTLALAQGRDQRHFFVMHLASLFLGELLEEQGRMDEAIAAFRDAVSVFPHAHTASLALGQALVRVGRGDEGWAVGREMFGLEGPGVDPAVDPYVMYPAAQSWQGARRLAAMREVIRQ